MKLDIGLVRLAGALASHASLRQSLIAENVANADTPGYRARDVRPFDEIFGQGAFDATQMRATRDGHIGHGSSQTPYAPEELSKLGAAAPNGNTVSLEDQLVRSAEVQHSHDMALGIYKTSIDILRTSLGRGA